MSEAAVTTDVKWEFLPRVGIMIYEGDGFTVRLYSNNWWTFGEAMPLKDNHATDAATAKQDAERWILEREGRLPVSAPAVVSDPIPAPAPTPVPTPAPTPVDDWIDCNERLPEIGSEVEVRCFARLGARGWYSAKNGPANPTHWRLRPVDPHAVANCLFEQSSLMPEQIRAAVRHVVACDACQKRLEEEDGKR